MFEQLSIAAETSIEEEGYLLWPVAPSFLMQAIIAECPVANFTNILKEAFDQISFC